MKEQDLLWELDGPTNMLLFTDCSSCGDEYSGEGSESHMSDLNHQLGPEYKYA